MLKEGVSVYDLFEPDALQGAHPVLLGRDSGVSLVKYKEIFYWLNTNLKPFLKV